MIRRKQQDTAKGHSKKEWRDTGEKNQTDIQRKGVAGMDEEMVLCAASAYERKFYLNPEFNSLPEEVKQELHAKVLKSVCQCYSQEHPLAHRKVKV